MTAPAASTTALVTGASSGLGSAYADRLARRGHDLVLVARNADALGRRADEIRGGTGRRVDVLVADLAAEAGQRAVERRIREDPSITLLVNNAGVGRLGPLADADPDEVTAMLALNIGALTRLSAAAAAVFPERAGGVIINVSSAMALRLPAGSVAYAASKGYVLAFTQALHAELDNHGVRVQAFLPGAVRTQFWDESGIALESFPDERIMSVDDAVDASLAALDAGELVAIPSLPDHGAWEAYDGQRLALLPFISRRAPADRYSLGASAPAPAPAVN
jgi:short-subunit dehydrogenase